MHPCLQIPEIFRLIVNRIYDPTRPDAYKCHAIRFSDSRKSLITLRSLALTCRSFTSISLDALWYLQLDLGPLIRCLPDRVVSRKSSELVLERDISQQDCERLAHYAQRIRILGHSFEGGLSWDYPSTTIDPIIYPILVSRCSGLKSGPLFPNLIDLYISFKDFNGLAWLPRLVMSPHLQNISLCASRIEAEGGRYHISWDNLFSVLSLALTNLKSMFFLFHSDVPFDENNIFHFPPTEFDYPSILKTVQALESPTALDLISIAMNVETLTQISKFRSLRSLSFTLRAELLDERILNKNSSELSELPNLQHLYLCINDQIYSTAIICHLAPSCLQSLKMIKSSDPTKHWNVDTLIASLASSKCTSSLLTLEISCFLSWPDLDENVTPLTSATIDHLSAFASLQSISIYLNGEVFLSLAELRQIASKWPQLRVLDLRTRSTQSTPPIHITDLLRVASTLPHIEEIRLRVDTQMKGFSFAKTGMDIIGIAARRLRLLDVGSAPISDPEALASLLAAALPQLCYLIYGWIYYDEDGDPFYAERSDAEKQYEKDWDNVDTLLKKLTQDHQSQYCQA